MQEDHPTSVAGKIGDIGHHRTVDALIECFESHKTGRAAAKTPSVECDTNQVRSDSHPPRGAGKQLQVCQVPSTVNSFQSMSRCDATLWHIAVDTETT